MFSKMTEFLLSPRPKYPGINLEVYIFFGPNSQALECVALLIYNIATLGVCPSSPSEICQCWWSQIVLALQLLQLAVNTFT